MRMQNEAVIHAIKESVGSFEGKAFSSTTFHLEVDLKDNGAGRSIGCVTRPFKFGDASEFDKWVHLGKSLPIKATAFFDVEAIKEVQGGSGVKLTLVDIKPLETVRPGAAKGG
ncbi:MAG: hypothetical protein PHS32_07900 [Rhodoferax sp.]|uniref:hypothetical protein n=1 Tax=Rhodoferax sp. TaxID=50421 RepID=UPI0026082B17|nr:hypothetical protein [Rhodoferax sp.]MDD5333643.1 hypothetical protein [Rhodoferax sp.]MDD5333653.1 hypothetical protein [Rhodoferax sp.]